MALFQVIDRAAVPVEPPPLVTVQADGPHWLLAHFQEHPIKTLPLTHKEAVALYNALGNYFKGGTV